MDDVMCQGNEYFIQDCQHPGFGENNCVHAEDAGVVCQAPTLQIRLSGTGHTSSEGRVELNYNGQGWGTVCDDLWRLTDAMVACKMLGFQSAVNYTREASYGAGSGTIWLDNVVCTGSETSLMQCSHSGWGVHNCRHSEDAGVRCTNDVAPPTHVTQVTQAPVANIGPVVGGAIVGVVVLLVIIVVAAIIIWRVYFWRKHSGFTPVSVHVQDENVNLFADDDDDEHGLSSHDKDDEPLYHPRDDDDDVAPLDISDTKPS